MKQTYLDKIRKRKSYNFWQTYYKIQCNIGITKNKSIFMCRLLHNKLDTSYMYGYRQRAIWSGESLDLFIQDVGKRRIK